ncbi:MAG: biotin/lipoyl-binding protein, partial [Planctomycetota bacterium]
MSEGATMSAEGLAALRIDRSRKRRRFAPWLWIVLVAIVGGVVFASGAFQGLQVVEVGVAPAVRVSSTTGAPVEGTSDLTAAGYVVADRQSVLATKFTGRLYRLYVAEADFVKKGDVVAEVDHREIDAMILQAEAEVAEAAAEVERLTRLAEQAEAETKAAEASLETFTAENGQYEVLLADAQRRLKRDEDLGKSNAVALSDIEDRRTEVRSMEAKIAWTLQRRSEAAQRVEVARAQAAAAQAAVPPAEA